MDIISIYVQGVSFPYWKISAGPTHSSLFIRPSTVYYRLSSYRLRLLYLPDMRLTTNRWQEIWRNDGPALIGQARKKKTLYLVECLNYNVESINEFTSLEPT